MAKKSVKHTTKNKVKNEIVKPGIGGFDPLGKMPVHGHSNKFNLSASSHHPGTPNKAPVEGPKGKGAKPSHKDAPVQKHDQFHDRPMAKHSGERGAKAVKKQNLDAKASKRNAGIKSKKKK